MQVTINGLVTGLALAQLAVAFQVVYLPSRVFFLALGGVYALAPFLADSVLKSGMPVWVALAISSIAGAATAVSCEVLVHAPLERKRASEAVHLVASFGVYIVLVQAIAMIWGDGERAISITGNLGVSEWTSGYLSNAKLVIAFTATLCLLGVAVFLRWAGTGVKLRALSSNPTLFALLGHDVHAMRLVAFGISGLLASVISVVLANDIGFSPYDGLHIVVLAVVGVLAGGRRSFVGAVVGAIVLGMTREYVAWFWSARWQEAATFVVLAIALLLRSGGSALWDSEPSATT